MTRQKPVPSERGHRATREKKRHVLEVALRCFTEHGVEGTTIERIREVSGMSVGSLYHHFGNKEKIAAAVFREGMREFGEQALRSLEAARDSAEGAIKALVYANVDWICERPDWARFVFQHRQVLRAAGQDERWRQAAEPFFEAVQRCLAPHVRAGAIRQLPLDLLPALISGPTHHYARQWLSGRQAVSPAEYRELLADAAWRSVRAGPEARAQDRAR